MPSTTQKPCCTSVTSTTATAMASPMAPRSALRNHTERNERWEQAPAEEQGVRFAPSAEPAVEHPGGTGRLERAVGHHAGGDTEGAGTKPRIERAGQARRPPPVDSGASSTEASSTEASSTEASSTEASATEVTSARKAAATSSSSSRAERSTASIVARSRTGWPDPVADERGRELQRLGHLLEDGARRWGPVGPLRLGRDGGGGTAAFPATHSTRPTSLDRATAPAAAPVGG